MKLKNKENWYAQVVIRNPTKQGARIQIETNPQTNRDDAILEAIRWVNNLKATPIYQKCKRMQLWQVNVGKNGFLHQTVYQRYDQDQPKDELKWLTEEAKMLKPSPTYKIKSEK